MEGDVGIYVDALLGLHETLPLEIWGIIVSYGPWSLKDVEAMCEARPETFGKLRTGGYLWKIFHACKYSNENIKQLEGFPYRHFVPERDAYFICKMETWQNFLYTQFRQASSNFRIVCRITSISCFHCSPRQLETILDILNICTATFVEAHGDEVRLPWNPLTESAKMLYYMATQDMYQVMY